ncbi:hypothetical protein COT63_01995 [Candidatus Shapirobacteria bacterium CG09_land_8_20_14_0_10_38_17]|uniref:Uncharacterized protein n=1 Tax=Candidatus Shapirobacteria bacterium CG09_land_8_20_14_0_10_38_17 TaxID=1974884 RepID=A0A2H0WR05_9BACT|nr:MAG: hypothetical protein COT63_01995 [Candidatus Shapirobacteria bacterium CG09_land_8_20_14_0_10_38_17]
MSAFVYFSSKFHQPNMESVAKNVFNSAWIKLISIFSLESEFIKKPGNISKGFSFSKLLKSLFDYF